METIDMKIYEPVPGKKGLVREVASVRQRTSFMSLRSDSASSDCTQTNISSSTVLTMTKVPSSPKSSQ